MKYTFKKIKSGGKRDVNFVWLVLLFFLVAGSWANYSIIHRKERNSLVSFDLHPRTLSRVDEGLKTLKKR